MDTDQEQTAPEADDSSEQSGTPTQTVRVPNVSPGAKSGLDHTVIGADALAPPEGDDEADQDDEEPDPDPMPDGDLDARLAWVGEAQDQDTAKARADKVWAAHEDSDDPEATGRLASALHAAVYGKAAGQGDGDTLLGTVTVPEGLTGEDLQEWVSGDAVEGDETENPERFAAYQARRAAAGLDPIDRLHDAADTSKDPQATDADES
jgi:hypothetical protein